MKNRLFRHILCAVFSISFLLFCSPGMAENIDPDGNGSQYAWGENVGWLNLEPGGDGGSGVAVGDYELTGYMWSENIGWISLSCTNTNSCQTAAYGVFNDCMGNLSGYAWSENAGWISFACDNTGSDRCGIADYLVWIDPASGVFYGHAWGENIGWISFNSSGAVPFRITTSWRGGDSDGDGTPDCDDNCPEDPNKTEPGGCGCGVADTDSDSDGTPDCNDNCPDDPAKIEPGICGCGVTDADSDNDGTPDCNDNCPADPAKTEPGICGCGVTDADTDVDGTPDCNDGCPLDPDKIVAGVCGCGTADTDTDEDGSADCNDGCPFDANKTDPGLCGCGIADTDTDNDATPDCNDGCANDPNKTNPGQCGCGFLDTDTDADGIADCVDADDDNDGVPDGEDTAPLDNTRCRDVDNDSCDDCSSGTDVPANDGTDIDADGICDAGDNCPADANPDQSDIDQDGAGDICDVCPSDQTDTCEQSGSAAATIGVDGGFITAGTTTVEIPADALSEDTSISITSYDPSENSAGFVVGDDFQPHGNVHDLQPDISFNPPVTITFGYDQGPIEECGVIEQGLDIYRWNGADWEPQNATQNCALNTLAITTDHFSFYLAASPGAKGIKGDAAGDLLALHPTGDNKTDKGIKKALKHLYKSLDPKLWVNDAALARKGKKVFDEEKKAVKDLQKLMKAKKVPDYVKDACRNVINKLVAADKLLAETALSEAKSYPGTDKKVAKEIRRSEKALEKAAKELEKGKPDKTIDHYKKAWDHSQKAIRYVLGPGENQTGGGPGNQ